MGQIIQLLYSPRTAHNCHSRKATAKQIKYCNSQRRSPKLLRGRPSDPKSLSFVISSGKLLPWFAENFLFPTDSSKDSKDSPKDSTGNISFNTSYKPLRTSPSSLTTPRAPSSVKATF